MVPEHPHGHPKGDGSAEQLVTQVFEQVGDFANDHACQGAKGAVGARIAPEAGVGFGPSRTLMVRVRGRTTALPTGRGGTPRGIDGAAVDEAGVSKKRGPTNSAPVVAT